MKILAKGLRELKNKIEKLIQEKKYEQILDEIGLFEEFISEDSLRIYSQQEMSKSLLYLTPNGVCIFTSNRYLFVNKAWQEITGYSDLEAYKMNPLKIVHSDMKEMILQRSNSRLKGEKIPECYEIKIVAKDKTIKWIDISFSLIQFEDRKATLGILTDITEIKYNREALIKSEEKFRKLTELSPNAICIQTTESFLWANPAWSEISGYPIEEVLNMGPLDVIHPDMRKLAKQRSDNRLLNKEVKSRYDLKILTKDKKVKWLDMTISVIQYEGRTASLAVTTDITKQVEAQQALKESEGKYRSLIENLKHEYFFYRHNNKGMFEYLSPSIELVLGYTQEQFLTNYDKYLTNNTINDIAKQKTNLALAGIQQLTYELEIYDIQNNTHILEISESPIIDSEGNVLGVEGIAHDITEHKKTEKTIKDQLEEIQVNNEEIKSINEELNTVNDDLEEQITHINKLNRDLKISENKLQILIAQKDRFFSIIAHDLRSPVSNFVQTLELLKMNSDEMSKDKLNLFFNDLNNMANSTLKLLENLLIWSRSQLGHLEINKEIINVFSIVEDIRNLHLANLKMKNQRLTNNLPEDFYITSDKNIVHTVLRNLIINAIKFTPSGGEIIIDSQKDPLNKQTIIVKDNGVGIPNDKIKNLFDVDSDYTTHGTEREKGTGLGLVLCRELIEKLGGEIWVESNFSDLTAEKPEGTKFSFTIGN